MKKETIIAIFFGLLLGGAVAFFLIVKNKEIQLSNTNTMAPVLKISPSIVKNSGLVLALNISEPADGAIVNDDTITIKGKAGKNSLIMIQSPIKEEVFKNEKDEFSVDFPLAFGENTILVTLYPEDKQLSPQEKELKVYYMEEQ